MHTLTPTQPETDRITQAGGKPGKNGFTPAQEAYLRGKLAEAKALLADNADETVCVIVPGGGRFTFIASGQVDAFCARLGKPVVQGRNLITRVSHPRQTPLSRGLANDDGVADAFVPLERIKAEIVSDGNVSDSPKYVTDGHILIGAKFLTGKLPDALTAKPKHHERKRSAESLEKLLTGEAGKPGRSLTLEGVYYRAGHRAPYAFFTDAEGIVTIADAGYVRVIYDALEPDVVRQHGKGALCFWRDGQPVALLMPLKPSENIGTATQLAEMREALGTTPTPAALPETMPETVPESVPETPAAPAKPPRHKPRAIIRPACPGCAPRGNAPRLAPAVSASGALAAPLCAQSDRLVVVRANPPPVFFRPGRKFLWLGH